MIFVGYALLVIMIILFSIWLRHLKLRREELFLTYLDDVQSHISKQEGFDWIAIGYQKHNPTRVDVSSSIEKLHATHFWNYDFQSMVRFKS